MFEFDAFTEQNFSKFTCIGGECEATCCTGWTIFIDRKTYNKCKKIKQAALRNLISSSFTKVTKNYSDNNYAFIRMDRFGLCPCLRGGLCVLHKSLGEPYLSKTCNRYPRKINLVLGELEASLGLSCPEAARQLLLKPEKMQFVKTTITSPVDYGIDEFITPSSKIDLQLFYSIRNAMIGIIQNRSYKLEERLILLGRIVYKIQEELNKGNNVDVDIIVKQSCTSFDEEIAHKSLLDNNFLSHLELAKKVFSQVDFEHPVAQKLKEVIQKFMNGLGISSAAEIEASVKKYEDAYFQHYETFIKDNGYIFENYLVHYVFINTMPLSKSKELLDSFVVMEINYALIRTLLVGISSFNKGLSQSDVIEVIYSFTRILDHNKYYSEGIFDVVKFNKMNELSYLEVLIHGMNPSEKVHKE